MKKILDSSRVFLFIMIVTSSSLLAGPLTSVGNDTCWYKEGDYRTKIASFNDQISLNTSRDDILAPVVKFFHKKGFKADQIDAIHTYGICGPRLAIAFRVTYDAVEYCLRANASKDGELVFDKGEDMLPLAASRKGACEGINPHRLIISIKSDLVVDLQKYLNAKGHIVKKAQHLSGSVYVLDFSVERDEIKKIKTSVESSGLARSVSFSSGQYHIADEFELLSLSYFRK
ncbi:MULTISPECIES: hypothetical protein [Halobacteriovorax]|uniref:Uncharacterized protein n=1 Tax=Halobacteriovorax vibrionivorans TaxID=2152716 RepID=A0ABY0ID39_9BACT|nr:MULTISPECIES: hypothetical protein [Halobacteriovorax]RZF20867.1 hypothetical protein DAY19_12855 [Halobacteriovorax vibrionivorans]TGD46218.1 hypothetical protein EP118_12865 [Halobacteriovorax sp. Y22]